MKEIISQKAISNFPSTRYQGSKRKILGWLHDCIREIKFNSALDAFGGTGAVSYLLKLNDKEVTFNDSLRFNHIIGKALIENRDVKFEIAELESVMKFESRNETDSFISKHFQDIYFTKEENLWIDNFLYNINSGYSFKGTHNEIEYKKSIALFALFQAALTKRPYNLFHRKNLYMRTNDVKRNFGNKTTWEKTFPEQMRKFVNEANGAIFDNGKKCRSINESIFNLQNDYDLVYLDPPYVNKNGDHDTIDYLYCYHFLEGMSKHNEWLNLVDFETKNLRFKKEYYSADFKKKNVKLSFEKIFEKFRDSIIVVSYKANGIPTIEEIESLLGKFKKRVIRRSKPYVYALNKQNGDANLNREVVLIGL